MKRALVTGGAGFIARHLIPKLLGAGYNVTAIDPQFKHTHTTYRLVESSSTAVGWSLGGPDAGNYDVVVHLAANIEDVDTRHRGGVRMFADIEVDRHVLAAVERHPPRECFIAASSCAVDNPEDPYGWVKLTLERMCGVLHRQGVPVVILRPFSGYGADQADSYPFPAILKRALRLEDPLVVWGSGQQVRDFIHVEDLAAAFVWAIQKAPRGIPIEIGTGIGTAMCQLARDMAAAARYSPKIRARTDKAESSPCRVADITLAEKHGFKACITLGEGIRRAIEELAPPVPATMDFGVPRCVA